MPNCMGAGPPAGDGTRPARRRSSDGGGLQVVGPVRDQLVGHHVDGRPRLFEHRVADQRLISTRPLLHLEEDHLVDDPPESFDLDPDRSPDVGPDDALIGGLEIDRGHGLQIAQLLLPGEREDQSGRARVDECAEALPARRVSVVRHGDLHEDFSHRWRPPREEWPDSVHTSTSLQCLESSYHGRTCPPRPAAPAPSLPCTASSSSRRSSARSRTRRGSFARWPAPERRSPACAGHSRSSSRPAPASTSAACAASAPSSRRVTRAPSSAVSGTILPPRLRRRSHRRAPARGPPGAPPPPRAPPAAARLPRPGARPASRPRARRPPRQPPHPRPPPAPPPSPPLAP